MKIEQVINYSPNISVHVRRDDGLEVEGKPSRASADDLCFLIVGPTAEIVEASVRQVTELNPTARFNLVRQAADGSWTTFGRVPR